jgi:hypothetical protein
MLSLSYFDQKENYLGSLLFRDGATGVRGSYRDGQQLQVYCGEREVPM